MIIGAIIIGCVTGFVSAFFGIGGSSIDTPLLRIFLHFPPYLALGTPLPTAFLTVVIALITYWKSYLVNFRVWKYSLIGGLPGIIAGSFFSQFFSGKTLMLLTAVILFVAAGDFLIKSFRDKRKNDSQADSRPKSISSGYIVGVSALAALISGVLANGAGLFLIPAYVMFFGMKIKEAIATSLLTVAILILPACLIHYQLGHIDLYASAAMGIGVIPMAYVGAKMDMRAKSSTIQMLFGLMLIVFATYFFMTQIQVR